MKKYLLCFWIGLLMCLLAAPRGTYADNIASGSGWYIDQDGCLYFTGAIHVPESNFVDATPWKEYKSKIKKAVAVAGASIDNCYYMLSDCVNLETADLRKLDVSKTTTLERLFSGCVNLISVNLSGWNTSSVTDMSYLLYQCYKLKSADLSGFDTSLVKYFDAAFSYCRELEQLNISSFRTSAATSFRAMFNQCNKLETIDVSKFDTGNVGRMEMMFMGCWAVKKLDVSGFKTGKVYDMSEMFGGCSSLTELDVSHFDTSRCQYMFSMFRGCEQVKVLDVSGFNTHMVTSMGSMFAGCQSLETLELKNFQTSKVQTMSHMFWKCSNLKSLDLSSFDTSAVTEMMWMFMGCEQLESVELKNFDTSKVTLLDAMFQGCKSLKALDLSNFKILANADVTNMLKGAVSLEHLWLSRDAIDRIATALPSYNWANYNDSTDCFDAKTIKNAAGDSVELVQVVHREDTWFIDALNTLHITGAVQNESTTTDLSPWKSYKGQITAVRGRDGASIDNGAYLFANCSALTSLDLSHVNTGRMKDMNAMFYNSSKIKNIDLTTFDISNVTKMDNAFSMTKGLKSLYVPKKVTSLGNQISSGIEYIKVDPANPVYNSKGDCNAVIETATNTLVLGSKNTVIPNTVTRIYGNAFFFNLSVKELVIPSSVNTIDTGAFIGLRLTKLTVLKKNLDIKQAFNLSISGSIDEICGYANSSAEAFAKEHRIKFTTLPDPLPFTDLSEGTWQYNTAYYVYTRGLMRGTTSTTFSPNQKMSRAQFIVVLWRMEGEPQAKVNAPFTDVTASTFGATAIQWGKEHGLIAGYKDGSFKPGSRMTREQFMAFMQRYAKYKGYDVSTKGITYTKCADANLVSPTFAGVVEWAYECGFIGATGKLNPRGEISRIEAAAVIERFDKYYK